MEKEAFMSYDPWSNIQSRNGIPGDELISMLQKSIRRGLEENALAAAYEMYITSPQFHEKAPPHTSSEVSGSARFQLKIVKSYDILFFNAGNSRKKGAVCNAGGHASRSWCAYNAAQAAMLLRETELF